MGITASPGGSKARIKAVCDNLNIRHIESRSEDDPDVAEHIHDISIELVNVDLPEQITEVSSLLRSMYARCIGQLNNMGFLRTESIPNVRYVIEMSKSLRAKMCTRKKNGYVFKAMSLQAMAIKVGHALELAETQGLGALSSYLAKLKAEAGAKSGSKASRRIVSSPEFEQLEALLADRSEAHPKVPLVVDLVSSQLRSKADSKVMVFTNYRDSCETVSRSLAAIEGARVSKLIGQTSRANDRGQRQKEQVEVLTRLRSGAINTVVATCVGEEGLDVANTDLVIFYEPVPSEIRSIQRRGRTGRSRPGRVVVLVTKGTSDEPSLCSCTRKEAAMKRNLLKVKKEWCAQATMDGETA
jgi:Fanconi anemia group M protein